MKIAIIDKVQSKNRYSDHFPFEFDEFHMSDVPITKLLKKDVTLEFDPEPYDLIILVGSEAAKNYAGISSVTNMSGQLVKGKYICMPNPAVLLFKPEGRPDFERTIYKILAVANGDLLEPTSGDFDGINDTEKAREYLLEILDNAKEYVAWDTETTALYPRDGYVLGISLTYKEKQGRYILSDCLDEDCVKLLQKIADTFISVFHNIKFDYKMLQYHFGLHFREDAVHDTMLLHYTLDENSSHGLKYLALKYTDYGDYDSELELFKKSYCSSHNMLLENFTYDLIPYEIMKLYASIDTAVTYVMFEKFWPLVTKNSKLLSMYNDLLLKGTLFLMRMEEVGIPLSIPRLKAAKEYLNDEILDAKNAIYKFEEVRRYEKDAGGVFNPNSVTQLRKVLFDYVGLTPTTKKTGTGAISTDAEVLQELSLLHPLPAAVLKVRQLSKIQNTYIDKILPEVDIDKRIRTNFNLVFTTSGRLSSSGKFNAQQIPRDDPIIKGCIVAEEGYKIVSQDLVTGECYYAAVLSKDTNLQNIFKTGGDLHSSIAKSVFNLGCDVGEIKELYPTSRQAAKAITFGILYGSGAQSVADSVSSSTGEQYHVSDAQNDIDEYFNKFKQLKKWLGEQDKIIRRDGFTYSHFGRKRRLANVFSKDRGVAAHEVRSGINALIQSVCSDINLLAAMDAELEIKRKGIDANIFALVHDSIVAIVKDTDIDTYCSILKECTQKDRGCSIPGTPIGVTQDIGTSYSFGKFEETYEIRGNKLARI